MIKLHSSVDSYVMLCVLLHLIFHYKMVVITIDIDTH